MKIDIHAHLIDQHYYQALIRDLSLDLTRTDTGQTLMRRNGYTFLWYRDAMFDIDHRIRLMDSQGIDMRVLSLSSPNVYEWRGEAQIRMAQHVNDMTAVLIKAHPDRFAGLASLPLHDIEASLQEIDRATQELDLRGVMIGSNVAGMQLDEPRFEPIWEKLNSLGLPVFEHPMFPPEIKQERFELPLRLGFVFDTTTVATRLIYSGVFERYPNFPYIMAHTGGALLAVLERLDNGYRLFPDCRQHISQLPSFYAKKLYYDTCSFSAPLLMMAREFAGADHILFGSDEPMIGRGTDIVDSLPIAEEERSLILGGNAARLLKLRRL